MNTTAIKNLLFNMADDALIIGHRNSEWTGIGPMLEEDLAFSSMAQDKIGHALALYTILHEQLGEPSPDVLGFMRSEKDFRSCHFVELPIGEYDFSLIRHFLFDHAEAIRYEMLTQSTYLPLAQLAKKVKGEIKYHTMHADAFVRQLAAGTEESKARMQSALNYAFPLAHSIFEPGENEKTLIAEGVFAGEEELKKIWREKIIELTTSFNLILPTVDESKVPYGGRKGFHSEHLSPLLSEMTEVTLLDTKAEW